MSERSIGWAFVAGQTILLVALIAVPHAGHWPTPAWLEIAGLALVVIGLGMIAVAALRLGRALTPTPVPTADARLRTDGLYRWVRHPIYTGVLLAVAGATVRSGSVVTLAVAGVTFGFFTAKARWEEQRLRDRFPDYAAYAAATPRFLPRPTRSRHPRR